jgi:D-alanyl-D-alanine carboxypeptidase
MGNVICHRGRTARGFGAWAVLLLVLTTAVYVGTGRAEAKPTSAAIIVDSESGAVLYETNANSRAYPASLTKMMTLYLLFEALETKRFKLADNLPVSAHAAKQPATNLRLKAGQRISVERAIQALVVHSANDVAVVVAEAIGGTESQFAAMMTKKARQLGMSSTTFRNASGLPDSGQTTTARDMAVLARALIARFPDYYSFFSTQSFTHGGRVYTSHNRVLQSFSGADGLKTGYIRASGFNVATSAVRDGRRLVAVVLGGSSARARDLRMVELLESGFALAAKPSATQVVGNMLPPPPTAKSVAGGQLIPPAKPTASDTFEVASLEPLIAAVIAESRAAPGKPIWGIQVGAFNSYQPALTQATRVAQRLGDLVRDAQLLVDETAAGKKTLYRARFVGLTKQKAQNACRQLKAKAIDCLVFQADVEMAMNQTLQ